MSPHAPSANSAPYKIFKWLTGEPATTTIDFVLPNQRFEQIRAGKLLAVQPHHRDARSRAIYAASIFVAAWNILPWLPIVPFILQCARPAIHPPGHRSNPEAIARP